ncbi:MAG: hypothetical protein MUF26_01845 [Syntrophales bacterium]|jgi:hypothetical protein|nr:hypothetical protein [Syntrophales bacterium]
MLSDIDYDLMETITIIQKSLYRYESLMQNADNSKCENCMKIWKTFRENREKELEVLLTELKNHTFTWAP